MQRIARDVGYDFLVRGAGDEIALVPILHAQELRPVLGPPARLLPQLGGLKNGHDQLEGPGAVHFLANDPLHFPQRAQAHRQPAIQSVGESPDEAGPQHELVADDLGLGGGFL